MKITCSDWTPEQIAAWKKTRAHGERRFVWTHGVVQWGGFMFFFTMGFYQVQRFGDLFSTNGNLPLRLAFAALIWTFVGYLYGRSMWRRNEREYLRLQQH